VRITAQLIQVRDQTHLWAEEYDRELRDMLALQRDVSSKIANHMDVRIRLTSAGRLSSTGTRPVNPIAYEDFLKGRYYLHKWLTQDDALERSKHYLEDAISADSDYAPAYAGLAQLYFLRVFARSPPREVMPLAEKFALKALALNDGVAEAHDILGAVKLRYYWDFPAAEREIKRALELDPSCQNRIASTFCCPNGVPEGLVHLSPTGVKALSCDGAERGPYEQKIKTGEIPCTAHRKRSYGLTSSCANKTQAFKPVVLGRKSGSFVPITPSNAPPASTRTGLNPIFPFKRERKERVQTGGAEY